MASIRIIDLDFNLLGEIDNYESLQFFRRFYRAGEFELHIAINKRYVDQLQKGRIIILDNKPHKAGIITTREIALNDDGSEKVVVKGPTLGGVLERRVTVTESYDRISGPAETVMKHYVNNHMVNGQYATGDYADRKIPFMSIAPDQQRGTQTPWQTRYEPLDQVIGSIANWCDIGWQVYLDVPNKKWVFDVVEGRDLTVGQTTNPPVIFSRNFDNVQSQEFKESDVGYRNVGYAAGSGEDEEQTVLVVGNASGFDRREVFIDASEAEDVPEIIDIGSKKLSEYRQITSFDGHAVDTGSFIYEQDWDLGDIVTLQDPVWSVQLNTRIIEVREIYEDGLKIEVQFGNEVPTITSVVKSLQSQVNRVAMAANEADDVRSVERSFPDDSGDVKIKYGGVVSFDYNQRLDALEIKFLETTVATIYSNGKIVSSGFLDKIKGFDDEQLIDENRLMDDSKMFNENDDFTEIISWLTGMNVIDIDV